MPFPLPLSSHIAHIDVHTQRSTHVARMYTDKIVSPRGTSGSSQIIHNILFSFHYPKTWKITIFAAILIKLGTRPTSDCHLLALMFTTICWSTPSTTFFLYNIFCRTCRKKHNVVGKPSSDKRTRNITYIRTWQHLRTIYGRGGKTAARDF